MAYIGKEPIVGNFQVCDAISVVNGQAAYTMQVSSTNVVPESANHMLVSLNGILQKPGSSFTVSGSTITFASALSTGDVIDFIMLLGNVLDLGVPSDATVTDAKTNFVSTSSAAGLQIKGDGTTDGTLQLNCSQNSHGIKLKSPSHSSAQSYTLTFPTTSPATDKFLKTDSSGNLSFADAGGDCVKLATGSASAQSSISIDGYYTSDYNMYKLYAMGVYQSATSQDLYFRINIGGSAQSSGDYAYAYRYQGVNSSGANNVGDTGGWSSNAVPITNNQSSSATYPHCLDITIFDPLSTTARKNYTFHNIGNYNNNSGILNQMGGVQFRANTSAHSGITLYAGGSNTTTMEHWVLYGFKI
ncbi:hypothetical protein HTVC034P_gp39 [Pelagibacter phage HTVC034P]|nr:hypothetical protein HTVC034P_gp39 [Pelagibacter phage HTVC034P]